MLSLRIFICVTAPLCWASRALEGIEATVMTAKKSLIDLDLNFSLIKEKAQSCSEKVRDALLETVALAEVAVQRRKKQYLKNRVTECLEILSGRPNEEQFEFLRSEMSSFFSAIDFTVDQQRLQNEIANFTTRPDSEANADDAFWSSKGGRFLLLSKFRSELSGIAVSEASVERSFSIQGRIWNARRNRLAESTVDDLLFVKQNMDIEIEKPFPSPNNSGSEAKHSDVTKDAWLDHLKALQNSDVRQIAMALRPRQDPSLIRIGSVVEVEYGLTDERNRPTGSSKWYSGVVVNIVDQKNFVFEVAWKEYDRAKDRIGRWAPATDDKENHWRFAVQLDSKKDS